MTAKAPLEATLIESTTSKQTSIRRPHRRRPGNFLIQLF